MPAADSIIQLVDVSRTVPSGAGPLTILHPLTLDIARGRAVAVTGASGSGKSTPVSYTHLTLPTILRV